MKKSLITITIILCSIMMIGVGVYAAQVGSSTLNSSGTVGFTSSEAFISVQGYIALGADAIGSAVYNQNSYDANYVPGSSLTAWTVSGQALNINKPTLNLELRFTNNGQTTVTVTVTRPTVNSSYTLFGGYNSALQATSNNADTTTIAKGATVTFRYSFGIKDWTKNVSTATNFGSFSIAFVAAAS